MKKSIYVLLILIVSFNATAKAKFGLHFDDQGKIIKPDQEFLWRGFDDERAGARNSAMKNFMLASEFGNYHAMSLVGFYHMQDKQYPLAHAWFRLVDLEKIPNKAYLEEMVNNLEQVMSESEQQKADELYKELIETYGSYPTMNRRMEWKKNLKFTGTHIKGYIPPFLRIQLNSGIQITGNNLKKQVDDFIFDYEFSFGTGKVTLDEIKVVETTEE